MDGVSGSGRFLTQSLRIERTSRKPKLNRNRLLPAMPFAQLTMALYVPLAQVSKRVFESRQQRVAQE